MRQPTYLSKFTLKDYRAGLVRKDSEDEDKPSNSSLSAEAKPFLPLKTYILVSSFEYNISFTIPVFSGYLSIFTLREYFPMATNMYYIQNGRMITLATSKNYNMVMNTGTELSELKFCIPDSCHQYFVSEHDEVDRQRVCETTMEEAAKCVEGVKYKLRSAMAEVEKLEKEVSELLKLLRAEAGETFLKMNNMTNLPNNEFAYNINQNYLEDVDAYNDDVELVHSSNEHAVVMGCPLGHKESELHDSSLVKKELLLKGEVVPNDDLAVEEKKYFDDYGFSDTDTDIDDDIDVVTDRDVECKEVKEENIRNVEVEKSSLTSSPVDAVGLLRFKSESCSLSSRPRCVRKVVGK